MEEQKLLRYIRSYKGDFYQDLPVLLEWVYDKTKTKDLTDYQEFKKRYSGSSLVTEVQEGDFVKLVITTNLKYILKYGKPEDLNYISKYYES